MNDAPLLIAILRGIEPLEVDAIADALMETGFRVIEVPLNSPDPFTSISRLRARCGPDCVVGAGTVLDVEAVDAVFAAHADFIVTPNTNPAVIVHAIALGMGVVPGFATATEALQAAAAGAGLIKLFPAATYGPDHVRALRSILPGNVHVVAVGGIGAGNVAQWSGSGIVGIGIGSELYRPGLSAAEVRVRAAGIVTAARAALPTADEHLIADLRRHGPDARPPR
jgi:2-dehydro-3-deoxyphosphogalactonate aldolase